MRTRLIQLVVIFFIIAFGGTLGVYAQDPNELIERHFDWTYAGNDYQLTGVFLVANYTKLQALPRFDDVSQWDLYVTQDSAQVGIISLVEGIEELAAAEGMGEWEKLHFTIAFVQSLEYISDEGEYPKYPVETLVDLGGDCEDTSILLATLLLKLRYEVMLVLLPGHMAVAVEWSEWLPLEASRSRTEIEGSYFYLVETTMVSPVGSALLSPDEIEDMIRPVQRPFLSLTLAEPVQWRRREGENVGLIVSVEVLNMGSAASVGVVVKAEVLRSANSAVATICKEIETLEVLAIRDITFNLTAPVASPLFLRISISVEEEILDEFMLRLRSP
jgi:hypothetical protein